LTLDLGIDLGENFRLRGNGLKAELDGALRLQALDKRGPRASGSIGIKSGSYRAYGQNLTITYGKLNFSGALDNPGLNLLAVRKVQNPESEVEAGIELRGTLQAPQARLVSTPSVPDSEKLMWLVLGHGTEGGADKDNPLLGLAMGALFGSAQSDQFASKLAIDEINLSHAQGLESTVVSVGKRLSSKAFLTLEQGASSATSLLKLRYTFNPRLSVQVQTGTNNAVDVFYTWRFD
jgi:translocation and assembly module TamB